MSGFFSARTAKVAAGLLFGLPLAIYLYAFALTYTDRFQDIPDEVWESGDFDRISSAAERGREKRQALSDELGSLFSPEALASELPTPAPALQSAAEAWVIEVNTHNPQAILYHEIDVYGNLYVLLGGWWGLLEPDHQVEALDALGVAWRHYLRTSFGPWDSSEGFAPGIVVVDKDGEIARNLDGRIVIHRVPTY